MILPKVLKMVFILGGGNFIYCISVLQMTGPILIQRFVISIERNNGTVKLSLQLFN